MAEVVSICDQPRRRVSHPGLLFDELRHALVLRVPSLKRQAAAAVLRFPDWREIVAQSQITQDAQEYLQDLAHHEYVLYGEAEETYIGQAFTAARQAIAAETSSHMPLQMRLLLVAEILRLDAHTLDRWRKRLRHGDIIILSQDDNRGVYLVRRTDNNDDWLLVRSHGQDGIAVPPEFADAPLHYYDGVRHCTLQDHVIIARCCRPGSSGWARLHEPLSLGPIDGDTGDLISADNLRDYYVVLAMQGAIWRRLPASVIKRIGDTSNLDGDGDGGGDGGDDDDDDDDDDSVDLHGTTIPRIVITGCVSWYDKVRRLQDFF